jgi:hypothetical protein
MTLLIIACVLVIYALVMTWKATSHTAKILDQTYADSTKLQQGSEFILKDDSILALQKEVNFLQSRLKMANSDSICLTIDLHDSLLMLELEGVPIHQAKIYEIKTSPVFSKIFRTALVGMFSDPFRVDSTRSTIIKEPIIVKKAPADTIEAASQAPLRDTVPPPPAIYHLCLHKDLIVMVTQTDITDKKNDVYRSFIRKTRQQRVAGILRDLIRFRVPDYTPWILIYIPQDDAITTYRAIPYHALVTVRI